MRFGNCRLRSVQPPPASGFSQAASPAAIAPPTTTSPPPRRANASTAARVPSVIACAPCSTSTSAFASAAASSTAASSAIAPRRFSVSVKSARNSAPSPATATRIGSAATAVEARAKRTGRRRLKIMAWRQSASAAQLGQPGLRTIHLRPSGLSTVVLPASSDACRKPRNSHMLHLDTHATRSVIISGQSKPFPMGTSALLLFHRRKDSMSEC